MDTANPLPDATAPLPDIEVLIAHDIADDDSLWVVRCLPAQLVQLLLAPVEWVASLAKLPDWLSFGTTQPAPAPTLTSDFFALFRADAVQDPLGRIVVQGISGTNQLSVTLSPTSLAPIVGPTQAFWDLVAADPAKPGAKKPLPVDLIAPIATFFAHFEIGDASMTALQRAARAAQYLVAATLDPAGHAKMLSGLDQKIVPVPGSVLEVQRGAATLAAAPSTVTFAPAAYPAPVVYGNVEGSPADGDPPTPENCTGITGGYDGSSGTVGGVLVKRYGVESDKPKGT